MKYFLYAIICFAIIWIIWYIDGGPLKENRKQKFIIPNGDSFEYINNVNTGLDKYINQ